jgi:hypothetical protein
MRAAGMGFDATFHTRVAVVGSPGGPGGFVSAFQLGPPAQLRGFDFPKSAERGCDVSGKGIAACDSFRAGQPARTNFFCLQILKRGSMNGLIVIGTTLVGGFIGGCGGMVAAMFYADMEIGSLDGPAMVLGGIVLGAAGGAYVGGQIVAS